MNAQRLVALKLAYHGAEFAGFQRQAGADTVQEELERALLALTGEAAVVHGAGRTDSGVHAVGQVAHFATRFPLPEERWPSALNSMLHQRVAVQVARDVGPDFHARFSSTGKRYLYRVQCSSQRPVLGTDVAAWVRGSLDLGAMRSAALTLLGRHDFSAFAAAGGTTKSSVRTLRAVHIRITRGGMCLLFEGDGFLYRMVRNLVGSLLEVGRGRRPTAWVSEVLASGDRRLAGPTAPAQGLCLWRVLYPQDPFAA